MSAVLSMPPGGRLMVSPQLLKDFKADFETARSSCQTAELFIQAQGESAAAAATMYRTKKAAFECGAALKRMRDTESYRDNYPSWTALCRALKLPRRTSYALMAYAAGETKDTVPTPPIGIHATPIVLQYAEADGDDGEIENEPDPVAANPQFAKLREALAALPDEDEPDELEAPKQPKVKAIEHDVAWLKRQADILMKWFEANGLGEQAAAHINSLIEIAATTEA